LPCTINPPGAQTNRPNDTEPVRCLLGGMASPATVSSGTTQMGSLPDNSGKEDNPCRRNWEKKTLMAFCTDGLHKRAIHGMIFERQTPTRTDKLKLCEICS
jgi:hypothetical protein